MLDARLYQLGKQPWILGTEPPELGGHQKAQPCQPSFRGQQGQPQHAGFKISRCGRISLFHPARVSRGESHNLRFLQLITPICEDLVFRALLLKLFSSSSRQRELFLCAVRCEAKVSTVPLCQRALRLLASGTSSPTLRVSANVASRSCFTERLNHCRRFSLEIDSLTARRKTWDLPGPDDCG